jgi:hypothetical protein
MNVQANSRIEPHQCALHEQHGNERKKMFVHTTSRFERRIGGSRHVDEQRRGVAPELCYRHPPSKVAHAEFTTPTSLFTSAHS